MVSFHVLLLDTVGNNLVNADFPPYLRHNFTVKHIYLTLYIAYIRRIAPIYSVPLYLARSAVHVLRPDRFQPLAVPCCSLRSLSRARSARCGRRTSGPIGSSRSPRSPARARARVRACSLCSPVCAPADAWSTVDFFVRRPRVACLACPLSVCVWARACARVRGRCPPTFQSLAVHFIRL